METELNSGVEELPLSEADIELAITATCPSVSVEGGPDKTCLLTREFKEDNSTNCTWRVEQECLTKAEVKKIPVYDSDCYADSNGVHSNGCQVR